MCSFSSLITSQTHLHEQGLHCIFGNLLRNKNIVWCAERNRRYGSFQAGDAASVKGEKSEKMSMTSSSTSSKRKRSMSRRLAYPFGMVKPGGINGDLTLDDINKSIMKAPTRPVRHPVGNYVCPPAVASFRGPGLSGKAVVAFTRIHTKGTGSVTIIRTKDWSATTTYFHIYSILSIVATCLYIHLSFRLIYFFVPIDGQFILIEINTSNNGNVSKPLKAHLRCQEKKNVLPIYLVSKY